MEDVLEKDNDKKAEDMRVETQATTNTRGTCTCS